MDEATDSVGYICQGIEVLDCLSYYCDTHSRAVSSEQEHALCNYIGTTSRDQEILIIHLMEPIRSYLITAKLQRDVIYLSGGLRIYPRVWRHGSTLEAITYSASLDSKSDAVWQFSIVS